MTTPATAIATTLHIGARTGWGVFGCNLGMQLEKRGSQLMAMGLCDFESLSPQQRSALAAVEQRYRAFWDQLQQHLLSGRGLDIRFEGDVLHCLGEDLDTPKLPYNPGGKRNFGAVFLENSHLSTEGIARGQTYQKILAGSTWNLKILRKHGLANSAVALQGIDGSLFYPGQKSGRWPGRFVIFSGGKLEYRKGQDLAIAAYRQFAKRHPDALLVFAWHNAWPDSARTISLSSLVKSAPTINDDGSIDFANWLAEHEVDQFFDLGWPRNWQMGELLREADVGVFPNRCEGGTNLVAMECMASGVPAILSANTGHLDLIDGENCFPLNHQGPVRPCGPYQHMEGWGESSVDEIVENLERVYADRPAARMRGAAGARSMQRLSWENQIEHLLNEMSG